MKTMTVGELRQNTAQVWRDLRTEQEIVVTQNGRPVGVLTPTSPQTLDEDIRAIRRARAVQAVASLQARSARAGLANMEQAEIDAEIRDARRL